MWLLSRLHSARFPLLGSTPNSTSGVLLRTIGGLDDYFDGQRTYSRDLTVGYLAQ